MEDDVRTPSKLVNGVNVTYDDSNMWLAPFSPGAPNYVYLLLDEAHAIGGVKFWNYSKTPSRGVGHVQIYVDHRLMFDGHLKPAVGASPTMAAAPFCTDATILPETVVFTPQAAKNATGGQQGSLASATLAAPQRAVRCIDEGAFKEGPEDASPGGPAKRPARPQTSVVGQRL